MERVQLDQPFLHSLSQPRALDSHRDLTAEPFEQELILLAQRPGLIALHVQDTQNLGRTRAPIGAGVLGSQDDGHG